MVILPLSRGVDPMQAINLDELYSLERPLLIDVRSPAEYQEDHLPGAINLPVLTNEEREDVGTLYHQSSTFEARQRGAEKICGHLPEILREIEQRADQERPVVVYCWRGGMRSESLAVVLDRIGYSTYRIEGGYKSYRSRVHEFFEEAQWNGPVVTLFGLTGSGKTKILLQLANRGHNVVDLEGAANHRGSAFGSVGRNEQPAQKAFENNIFQQIDPEDAPVFIEGESRHIGALRVPKPLFEELSSKPWIWIETNIEQRLEVIHEEYDWPEAKDDLINQLDQLRERLGHEAVDSLQDSLRAGNVKPVIKQLLEDYYDPAYRKSSPPKEEFDCVIPGNDPNKTITRIEDWMNERLSGVR